MKNWFKPRYKICYLTKNKVWPHKNSRLRNFFHIRSNIVLKRGWFKKYLAQRNMKWTVARRKMLPYFRKKKHFKYNYKNMLFLKQQLKNFYGKLKEYHLRNIFKEIVTSRQLLKKNALGTFLEQRLDMVLFRTRMMPSIFACNQLISHQGVYVNNILIKYPNKRINVGDIISIKHDQWKIFYDYIHEKVIYRDFAHTLLKRRIKKKIENIQRLKFRYKSFLYKNAYVLKEFNQIVSRFKVLQKFINYKCNKYKKTEEDLSFLNNNKYIYFKKIRNLLLKKALFKIYYLKKQLPANRQWREEYYYQKFYNILSNILELHNILDKIVLNINDQYLKWNVEYILDKPHFENDTSFESLQDKYSLFKDILINKYLKKKKVLNFKIKFFYKRHWKKTFLIKKCFWTGPWRVKKLLKTLKKRRRRKQVFRGWVATHHWYVPKYLEVDYKTLRAGFLYYPHSSEIHYAFECSLEKLISFFKERAL